MVAVQMRDGHGVEASDDLVGRDRERHERVRTLVRRVLDRGPGADVVERGVDEQPPPGRLDEQRRVPHEPDPHPPSLHGHARGRRSTIDTRRSGWIST